MKGGNKSGPTGIKKALPKWKSGLDNHNSTTGGLENATT
ncbi:hypothetical protein SAMN04488542_10562 [Fontibacillus panacisegetis]|uniref:Uncharacterized protein n=1 Tax=Fontibacillus panacisegetis TaxID=670482 RepID=A0A1G7HW83_9BACL|nr:hypothetical protein SAMN04488542_10562 [Fontibacillus panacisegetis]